MPLTRLEPLMHCVSRSLAATHYNLCKAGCS